MKLRAGDHIHLMGICGTAMASLAGIFKQKGFEVTGSDQNVYPPMSTQLQELGIEIMDGYKRENLAKKPALVIVGNVISRNNPEAEALLSSEIPYMSLPQALGEFVIQNRQSVVISGTHGKTTTTSLMAWTAKKCGLNPGFLIGGIPRNFGRSFNTPPGDWFVIEGDEYDTAFFDKVPKFIHYRPKHAVLTSLEFDHADIYRDIDDVRNAFRKLFPLIPSDGSLTYCADDKEVEQLATEFKGTKLSYGIEKGDYRVISWSVDHESMRFEVDFRGKSLGQFTTAHYGKHNLLNHLSVLSVIHSQGFSLEKVREAFKTFEGVKRRQEILGEPRGIRVIEDFAHHPTAVKLTVESVRQKYPLGKTFAVFEPRSATSRRKVFQQDYVEALKAADRVFISEAFDQSKIDESDRFSSGQLVEDLKLKETKASVHSNIDEIVEGLALEAQPGDSILVMSNGGFGGIYQKLLDRLEKN